MMTNRRTQKPARRVWIVDDDPEDQILLHDAFRTADSGVVLLGVSTGGELMARLQNQAPYEQTPPPDLILLDLNLPGMHGREILEALKRTDDLCKLPVVVLTTSYNADDVDFCYRAGANSYVRKPNTFKDMEQLARTMIHYWFDVVELPTRYGRGDNV